MSEPRDVWNRESWPQSFDAPPHDYRGKGAPRIVAIVVDESKLNWQPVHAYFITGTRDNGPWWKRVWLGRWRRHQMVTRRIDPSKITLRHKPPYEHHASGTSVPPGERGATSEAASGVPCDDPGGTK